MTYPYLSIVVVSRNDTHGGNLLERMQHFVDCLSEQVEQFRLPTELVLVEWNPPEDKPPLKDALRWKTGSRYLTVKIVTVPNSVHRAFHHSEKLPLFQMIGKNVGIRRAAGEFVLSTNIDIIFANELIETIAKQRLRKNCFYRADRLDTTNGIPSGISTARKIQLCRSHIIRPVSRYYYIKFSNFKVLLFDVLFNPPILWHYLKNIVPLVKVAGLNYNACGDFTLMSKEGWLDLRGYLELEMYSLHIDSLFLMKAHYKGYHEINFRHPLEIYHIEHEIGSGITPGAGHAALIDRLERNGIPYLKWRDCINIFIDYTGRRKNDYETDWGLWDVTLPETVV